MKSLKNVHFLFLLYLSLLRRLQKHGSDLDMTALWLKNVYLLHDLLTQHSLQEVSQTRRYSPRYLAEMPNLCCVLRLWARMSWFL